MERGGGGAAPTGCYKCGRPGHWSRDCLSHPSNGNNPNSTSTSLPNSFASNRRSTPDASNSDAGGSSLPKPKAAPRTRPKLTADSLLSDDGIGHVLRHFPRAFKYHGRGHEVSDLGNLIGLYSDWHSRLLPYYSFDQFVHKVEKIGASKRVKLCLRNLREKVANGVDPAKLQENEAQEQISNEEQENMNLDEPSSLQKDAETNLEGDGFQQEMNHDVWDSIVKEASPLPPHQPQGMSSDESGRSKEAQRGDVASEEVNGGSSSNGISEEQRARMEANKLKALQKAAAARAARTAPL
ncbi:unnamed protein product [Cuscuta campestris]|uniref:CCHC-type domain-containing protein n=1 Tax=Cuscuta campestris TaxID=132261 RepID=A0A484MCK5_9ASTE|nr:unnamed protein product [Cuscuta campestris]